MTTSSVSRPEPSDEGRKPSLRAVLEDVYGTIGSFLLLRQVWTDEDLSALYDKVGAALAASSEAAPQCDYCENGWIDVDGLWKPCSACNRPPRLLSEAAPSGETYSNVDALRDWATDLSPSDPHAMRYARLFAEIDRLKSRVSAPSADDDGETLSHLLHRYRQEAMGWQALGTEEQRQAMVKAEHAIRARFAGLRSTPAAPAEAPPSETPETRETAWLIERTVGRAGGVTPIYLVNAATCPGDATWTSDPHRARRFDSREAAEGAAQTGIFGVHDPLGIATEHVFLSRSPSPAPGGDGAGVVELLGELLVWGGHNADCWHQRRRNPDAQCMCGWDHYRQKIEIARAALSGSPE